MVVISVVTGARPRTAAGRWVAPVARGRGESGTGGLISKEEDK